MKALVKISFYYLSNDFSFYLHSIRFTIRRKAIGAFQWYIYLDTLLTLILQLFEKLVSGFLGPPSYHYQKVFSVFLFSDYFIFLSVPCAQTSRTMWNNYGDISILIYDFNRMVLGVPFLNISCLHHLEEESPCITMLIFIHCGY